MIKDYLKKDLNAKQERKAALVASVNTINKRTAELDEINDKSEDEKELKATADELDKLKAELADKQAEMAGLDAEIKELEQLIANADKPAADNPANEAQPQRNQFLNFEKRGNNNMNIEERKARAENFAKENKLVATTEEARAVLVSSGNIATPTEVDPVIRDNFEHVSSIVDLVEVVNCEGMGAHKVAYLDTISTADTTTEGAAYNSSDPTYGYVNITPSTVTVLSQVSKQVRKQSPLQYTAKVEDSAYKALRVKAATIITNAILASSLTDTTSVVATVSSSMGVIDDKTLRNIALAYGSDETVEGNAYLFLTKADLIAFGDVRSDTTLQAVYEITPNTANPNTGTIKDGGLVVNYCLNSNLTTLAGTAQTTTATPTMIYGQPHAAQLDLFSGYEIMTSEDYAFNTGMLTIRGDVELGADVVKKNGFIAVMLPATE